MKKTLQNSLIKRMSLFNSIVILFVMSVSNGYSQFNFSVEGPITITSSSYDITVGNFDNAGRPEAIVTHAQNYNNTTPSSSNIVTYIKYNTGSSVWESSIIENTGGYASLAITSGDYDSDGNRDFAFTANCNCGNYYLYQGDGADGFTNATPTFSGNRFSYDMVTGEFDNDGKPDILTGGNTVLSRFLNTSTGVGNFSFSKISFIITSSDNSSYGYSIADFNNDGFNDIVAAVPAEAKVRVFLNDGAGGFNSAVYTDYTITGSSTSNIRGVATGDFNDDGYPDIVAASYNGNAIGVLINSADGTGTFDPVVLYTVTTPKWVEIGDLNNDGFLDIVVAASNISIFSGNGDGTFATSPYGYSLAGVNRLDVADMNNDGRDDIAAITASTFRVLVSLPSVYTWTGAVSTDWNDAGNWDIGVPSSSSNILIPTGLTNYPQLEVNPTVNDITVATGTSIDIPSTQTFTVNGSLTNNGTINIGSSASGNGSLLISGSISGSGTYNVQRYLTGGQWHLVTSPITAGLAGVFENIWLRPYLEETNTFGDYIVPVTTPMPTGQGFSVWAPSAQTRTFGGTINHGSVGPLSIQLTGSAGPNQGWNLIGNPYPSAIDWDAASGWTRTNIADAVYVWNSTQYAGYIGGIGVNGGSRYVAPGQGFFVQATAAGASIGMANGICLHNGVSFLKETSEPLDIVRIQVNGNGYGDEAVIAVREGASDNFDPATDAVKLPGSISAPQMYSSKDDLSRLTISCLNSVNDIFGKAVYMDYAQDGQHVISWSHTLQGSTIPVLYDNLTGTAIQPGTQYVYTASSTDPAERFTFTEISMGIESQLTNINVWENNNILYIQNLTDSSVKNVSIYNMQGQLVMQFSDNIKDLSSLSPAVYIVKVNAGENSVVEKVTVK